jgi:hypothetical protein
MAQAGQTAARWHAGAITLSGLFLNGRRTGQLPRIA